MGPRGIGIVAALLCFIFAALLASVVAGGVLVTCAHFNPCPNDGPPCFGVSEVCRPSSIVIWLTLVAGVLAGVAGGVFAYRRSVRIRGA
jgi:hypothetical protein